MFCFASPETPGGLYINLASHQVRHAPGWAGGWPDEAPPGKGVVVQGRCWGLPKGQPECLASQSA